MTDTEQRYKLMLLETSSPWCWACGRGASDRPRDWGSPWLIERAHIVAAPRVEDRRAVILLCSACHNIQHGKLVAVDGIVQMESISIGFMLWLKKHFDPAYYNRKWLDAHYVGRLPRMEQPPTGYRDFYYSRKGKPYP